METAQLEQVLDHTRTPESFMDTTSSTNYFDTISGLDYLQYPHSPFGVGTMGRKSLILSPSIFGLLTISAVPPSASPRLGFNSLNLSNGGMSEYTYGSSTSFAASSPARPFTPTGSIYPGALSNLSAGELSSDSVNSGRVRRGSTTHSPSIPIGSLAAIPRSHRYNPIAATVPRSSTRQQKKRAKNGSDDFNSDDDEDFNPMTTATSNEQRREEIRRQRIESEQRRRDELRDGYRRLKDALPVSNQKSSKVSLLDRGKCPVHSRSLFHI